MAYCRTTTARFIDSHFQTNTSGLEGGAVYCANGATPRFERCTFTGNEASKGGVIASLEGSRPYAIDCTFANNVAPSGGAVYALGSSVVLESCLLTGNHAGTTGGACFLKTCPPQSQVIACTFEDNGSTSGGAVTVDGASLLISACTFEGNHATNYGGGVRAVTTSTLAMNSSIVAFSTQGQALYADASSSCALSCCDLYGNAGGDWTGTIAGQLGVSGNIARDPLFCDTNPLRPFLLQSASPCAPGGTAGCGQIGAWPVGCGSPQEVADPDRESERPLLASLAPSPFCTTARLSFTLPPASVGARLRIDVLDASGRCVRGLVDGPGCAGSQAIVWDGRGADGCIAPGGLYFFRLDCGDRQAVTRGVLLR